MPLVLQDDYLPDGHIQPDNYSNQVPTVDAPNGDQPAVVYEPRWDSWYRLMEPLFSSVSFPSLTKEILVSCPTNKSSKQAARESVPCGALAAGLLFFSTAASYSSLPGLTSKGPIDHRSPEVPIPIGLHATSCLPFIAVGSKHQCKLHLPFPSNCSCQGGMTV